MATIKEKLTQAAVKTVSRLVGSLAQDENSLGEIDKNVTPGMPELLREAAAQGCVLLQNNGLLPLAKGQEVSLFGRVQMDYFYTGYGSGGDVKKPYQISLLEGLRNCADLTVNEDLAAMYSRWCAENPIDHGYWGHWPRFYPECPISSETAAQAAARSQTAVVVIGRSSGEDRENALEPGSFYLTQEELALLENVTASFDQTAVVLNIGSIIDFSWLARFGDKIGAVLLAWQGGMESGNAVADILCGKVNPSGKLTDTVAREYSQYPSAAHFGSKEYNEYAEDIYMGYRWFETFAPDNVLYPFGFGLSYTDFIIDFAGAQTDADGITLHCSVTNSGTVHAGRETVQVYIEKPCGALGNPARNLCAFAKTDSLAPGESQALTLAVPFAALASYDSAGKTGFASAYVLEAGIYGLYLGSDVRSASRVWDYTQAQTAVTEQLSPAAPPQEAFQITCAVQDSGGSRKPVKAVLDTTNIDLRQRILENLPPEIPQTGDKGYLLSDVKSGKISLETFAAQLDLNELEALTKGDGAMNSPLGTPGNAGVFGGVLPSLRAKGIPPVTATDGPSGIRLSTGCSLLPIGTLLACTFDCELVARVYEAVGGEMREKGSDVLLAPGINLHRNPLCGRNFEYYSEDPFLTGKLAAAAVRGLQKPGVAACVKHFACNNQEYNRNHNDSRLSERALRELYLKGFEICVKEADPVYVMTSYNKINGVWGHYHYDLCTAILRGEWQYRGCVMTDWWMRSSKSPEFPTLRNNAYRVRAQVDILMPGAGHLRKKAASDKTLLPSYGKKDGITLGELQRTAMNVLGAVMRSGWKDAQ